MSLRTDLPEINSRTRAAPQALAFDVPSTVTARFVDTPLAADEGGDATTIHIMEDIGFDFWTGGGVTAKGVEEQLKAAGGDVTVLVNSPGGDLFEGVAIYNLLRMHKARVTVKVLGIAASAASIIAMAGDTIEMGGGSFIMIHNAWVCACGNRNDLRAVADYLEPFDAALRDVYAARTGLADDELNSLLDAETWLNADEAIRRGFADSRTDDEAPAASAAVGERIKAKRAIDAALAQQGMPRTERRRLMTEIAAGTQDAALAPDGTLRAADTATHDAGALAAEISRGIAILTN